MSTVAAKRDLGQAIQDAEAFRDMFPASCYVRWEFAGSLRRKRPWIGDIEHVILPVFGEAPVPGSLFGADTRRCNLLWHHLDALVCGGQINKAICSNGTTRWGEKYRGVTFRGFAHELFMADQDNWGAILAIRTGPSDYSKMLVTRLHDTQLRMDGGYLRYARDRKIYPCADEATFFAACRVEMPTPGKR